MSKKRQRQSRPERVEEMEPANAAEPGGAMPDEGGASYNGASPGGFEIEDAIPPDGASDMADGLPTVDETAVAVHAWGFGERESALSDSPVHQYRIEKDRVEVTVRLLGGEVLAGHVFVQHSAFRHLGREEPVDIFNAPEPYFPLATSEGVLLIAKDRVLEASGITEADEDELRRATARAVGVELVLSSGDVRDGFLMLEMPSDRPRLLDFLNTFDERFLTLYTVEGIRLINARHIERARPQD